MGQLSARHPWRRPAGAQPGQHSQGRPGLRMQVSGSGPSVLSIALHGESPAPPALSPCCIDFYTTYLAGQWVHSQLHPSSPLRECSEQWVAAKPSVGEPCAEMPHGRDLPPPSALSPLPASPQAPQAALLQLRPPARAPAPEKERFAFMKTWKQTFT